MTALTPVQSEILRLTREAVAGGGRILYRSEWLGWLPFGQYQGIEAQPAGVDRAVPISLPGGWDMSDVLAIEHAGHLRRIGETHEGEDDVEIIYELVEDG